MQACGRVLLLLHLLLLLLLGDDLGQELNATVGRRRERYCGCWMLLLLLRRHQYGLAKWTCRGVDESTSRGRRGLHCVRGIIWMRLVMDWLHRLFCMCVCVGEIVSTF